MSDELAPGALSLEATIEGPDPGAPAQDDRGPAPEAEPEGVVEVQGRRLVPVDAMVADRKRTRETTERAVRAELEPLRAKAAEADQLRQALVEAQPYLQEIRRHPEIFEPQAPAPIEERVTEAEARDEARDLELYAADGQPDLVRARRIIGRRRAETMAAAQQATSAALEPITSQTAQQHSRHNFVQMATQGRGSVDPAQLATLWSQLPVELTQHPQVGELVLNAAIGQAVRAGQAPARGGARPQVSEPSGGRQGPAFTMSPMLQRIARAAGMTNEAFAKGAAAYRPNDINVLGE